MINATSNWSYWLRRVELNYDPNLVPFYRERKRKRIARRKIFTVSSILIIVVTAILGPLVRHLVTPPLDIVLGWTAQFVFCVICGWMTGTVAGEYTTRKGLW
jgi:uncharacterized membrane protein YvlD (DUF360 family)